MNNIQDFPQEVQNQIKQLPFIEVGRATDITGQTFDRLYVLGRAPKPEGSKETKAFWWCICLNDYNIIKVMGKNLRIGNTHSCGCYKKDMIFQKQVKDLTNQRFGRLVPFEIIRDKQNHISWKCKCDCGKETIVKRSDLINHKTQSCGCLKKELLQNHLEGQRFGKLVVIKEVEDSKIQQTKWLCQCDCGNLIEVTNNHLIMKNTQSCGCLSSKSEMIIEQWLSKHNINFKKQYTFPDCKGKAPLRFDFAIFNNNEISFLLEYQGIQHYKNVYNLSNEDWQWSLQRDQIKKDYCKQHNLQLIEIRYDENLEEKLKCLLNIL